VVPADGIVPETSVTKGFGAKEGIPAADRMAESAVVPQAQ
jgi:hypothetical protein